MKVDKLRRDERGASAVEFAITAPIFFMVIFGIIELGLLVWTQIGLQHGAEMAARCWGINNTNLCGSTTQQIQTFAAGQAYGLNPPPSAFTPSQAPCGKQVSANYQFPLLTNYFGSTSLQITAQSCFPS